MIKSKPEVDYWPKVQSMIEADISSVPELILRYFVVACVAYFLALATGHYEIPAWLAAFLVFNGYYSWRLSRIQPPVSRLRYIGLASLLLVSVVLYTGCALYLFSIGTTEMKVIAIAGVVAQSHFNLSRHRKLGIVAYADTAIVVVASLYFGFSDWGVYEGSLAERLAVVVAILGVGGYYVIAQLLNVQTHKALDDSRIEAVQTQKMRAVGQLTAGVAHEFNNLLTVIRGNIELTQLATSPEERSARLKDAMAAADRASALTSQLLAFSRKARLQASTIELAVFWDKFETVVPRITPVSIATHIRSDAKVHSVYCDVTQFEVALINLVINARDAINGKGNIWIESRAASRLECESAGLDGELYSAFALVEVRDDGPGIPADKLGQVVEPFFTTKEVGEGTGLGLPMVKGFCEQSGGGMAIESSDEFTCIRLVLPIDRA